MFKKKKYFFSWFINNGDNKVNICIYARSKKRAIKKIKKDYNLSCLDFDIIY